jgi:phage gpG-like protein
MDIYKKILNDVRIDLADEFDRNFERKAFFNAPWAPRKYVSGRGSLLMQSGALRRSLRASIEGQAIKFSSSLPYAKLHNEGGTVTVTAKMKAYFWAMYYKSGGAAGKAKGERKANLSAEATMWKALALQKVGKKMKIPERRFIGNHPQVRLSIERAMNLNLKDVETFINRKLKPR